LPGLGATLPPLGEVFRASSPPRAGATTTGSASHASHSSHPSPAPPPARPAPGASTLPTPSVPTEPDMASTSADDTLGIATPAPRRAAPTPPPARRGGNAVVGWVVLASLMGMVLGGGCVTCAGALGGQGEQVDGLGGPRVAVVELMGPIMDGAETVRELRRHARAGDIRAIVVRIDSPGGAVAPSQEIFDAMRAASEHKPVVVSMGTMAASGGFWAAMAGDWIVASPGSITGSIGVISQMPDLRGLAELLRVDLKTYKSGPYKDAGNGLRAPQPGDEAVHMELISDVYEQFVATIAERRKIEPDAVRRFADGRIFTGRRAHELGLVDQLGGLYDAAEHALVLAEARRAAAASEAPEPIEDEPTLVYPRRPAPGLLRLLSEEAGAGAASGAGRVMERALDATLRDPRVELR
jgi:protease-4